MKIKRKKASIIIIGNEILSGKTLDTNSNYIAKKLRLKGIKCNSISVVPDDEKTIIQKVNESFDNFQKSMFSSILAAEVLKKAEVALPRCMGIKKNNASHRARGSHF